MATWYIENLCGERQSFSSKRDAIKKMHTLNASREKSAWFLFLYRNTKSENEYITKINGKDVVCTYKTAYTIKHTKIFNEYANSCAEIAQRQAAELLASF